MNELASPIQDILTGASSQKALSSVSANSSSDLDLEGLEESLKSFDSYLKDAKSAKEAQQNIGESNTSKSQMDDLIGGKISPESGKDVPLTSGQSPKLNGYLTAAEDLLANLNADVTGLQPDGQAGSVNTFNPLNGEQSNASQSANYGLFDSPIYQSLIGAGEAESPTVSEAFESEQFGLSSESEILDQSIMAEQDMLVTPDVVMGQTRDLLGLGNNAEGRLLKRNQSSLQPAFQAGDVDTFLHSNVGLETTPTAVNSGSPIPGGTMFDSVLGMDGFSDTQLQVLKEGTETGGFLSELDSTSEQEKSSSLSATSVGSKLEASQQMQRLKMETPVLQNGWDQEFTMKMRTLAANGEQHASLKLNPAELGSIEINMSTDGDKAKVHFVVQTAGARDVLENSLPKLKEFFEQSGMTLSESGVEDQSAKSGFAGQQDADSANAERYIDDGSESASIEESSTSKNLGLINAQITSAIDYYI